MKQFTYSLEGYQITSYGNGASYSVTKDGRSFHVQGDDAIDFELGLEDAGNSTGPYGTREFLADAMAAQGGTDGE